MRNAIATSKVKMSSSAEKKVNMTTSDTFFLVSTYEFSGEHIPRMDSFATYASSFRICLMEFFIVFNYALKRVSRKFHVVLLQQQRQRNVQKSVPQGK